MVRTAMSVGLMVATMALPAPRDSAAQQEGADERLVDGAQIHCVANDKTGTPRYQGMPIGRQELDRMRDDEFRAVYRVADDGMTAMVVFSHTIPLFDQIYFPPSVQEPSLTFLRTEPGVFMLFQLDPWDGDTAVFSWAERRKGEWFMARGECEMVA